jgi:hypothetical protein
MKRGKSQYNPSEIINNKPLQKAAAVIGAGWYGGYGAPWTQIQQDGNWNWNPIPSNWCAKFAIWAMTEAGLFQSGNDPLPYIIDAEPMVITDWFIRNNRYLYSFPAPYRDTDRYWHIAHKPTPYSQLGGMVKPGSYCYVRGHAAMFLYWIKPRDTWNKWGLNPRRLDMDDIDPLRSYDNFAKALIHTKPSFYCEPPTSDGEPGDFKADYDINWFAAICGNATMSVYWRFIGAVIHWRTWHWPLMKILAHRHSAEFVPWFEKGESGDEEDVGRLPPIWPPDKGEAPWPLDDNDLCKTYSSPEFRTDLLDKNFKAKFGALPNVTGFGLVY